MKNIPIKHNKIKYFLKKEMFSDDFFDKHTDNIHFTLTCNGTIIVGYYDQDANFLDFAEIEVNATTEGYFIFNVDLFICDVIYSVEDKDLDDYEDTDSLETLILKVVKEMHYSIDEYIKVLISFSEVLKKYKI